MSKKFLICVIWVLICVISVSAQEQITITTYYPSPYGSYQELRAQGMAVGNTYINNTAVCWTVGGATCPGGSVNPGAGTSLVVEGNVGIGTAGPLLKLDARGANAKATTAAFENIIQAASTDAANPLTLRLGIKTDAVGMDRYGAIEVDDAGTKRNLVLQPSGGNVGIGTTGPTVKLDVVNEVVGTNAIQLSAYNNNSTAGGYFSGRHARGTVAAPSQALANDVLTGLYGFGYVSGGAFGNAAAGIRIRAAENFTSTANGGYITFETVPTGNTVRQERMRITDNGRVGRDDDAYSNA